MVSGCRFVPLRYNFSLGVQLSGASPNHLLHLTAEAVPL